MEKSAAPFLIPVADFPAANTTRAAVVTALALAADGDRIIIPNGASVWATEIATTKSVQFIGCNGAVVPTTSFVSAYQTIVGLPNPGTVITTTAGNRAFALTPAADVFLTRVSGIAFVGADLVTEIVRINGATSAGVGIRVRNFRCDHCKFTAGQRVVCPAGWVEGLADHNWFYNNNIGYGQYGDNNQAWTRAINAGGIDAFFVELNWFILDNTYSGGAAINQPTYHEQGCRSTIRYNVFDWSSYTLADCYAFDSHGNGNGAGTLPNHGYYENDVGKDLRGDPMNEFYRNVCVFSSSAAYMDKRSGTMLMHDNSFVRITGAGGIIIYFTEEEMWSAGLFLTQRLVWPAQDQCNNTFLWNNTLNSPNTPYNGALRFGTEVRNDVNTNDNVVIQQNRDIFMADPRVGTPGSEQWTARQGGSQAAPTAADTSTMTFTAGVASPWVGYTEFTFPHPLDTNPVSSTVKTSLVNGSADLFDTGNLLNGTGVGQADLNGVAANKILVNGLSA